MSKIDPGSTLKRLQNRYRLVVMNEDTYEEVVTFRLSRRSVYVLLSSVFVLLVMLTVALIVFTPLKYYIPGYGSTQGGHAYRQLKYKTDSLEKAVRIQGQQLENLRMVIQGGEPLKLDTQSLNLPAPDQSTD
ncbi:hypothetical protein EPD60_05200 [Flaviaesturariibacter flavus]|uniref:Peptidase M23 n=1 Tax=Flaviaesturariibacter flavus TaxID=2502780 RepID=A0A4V6NB25_9BACT|nr:hypothetical protein [Flaviaesturariibacter flavus]TCJ17592.1 hypothetical protein EPD60_05200 [Flaviaesturariibacter flavus]